jgi:hypothetical protein
MPSQHAQDHPERIAAARSPTGIPGDNDGHNACLDLTQTKIIELLREVHLIAFKEIERLNMRIVELENQNRQVTREPEIPRRSFFSSALTTCSRIRSGAPNTTAPA